MSESAFLQQSERFDVAQERFLQGIGKVLQGPANEGTSQTLPSESWPVLNNAALHGLAGEVVRLLEPHTEADSVALLACFLAETGAMLNRGPHLTLDGCYHPLLFWPVIVGQSSKSRKGTAGKRIETLLNLADPDWSRGECKGTLSSGEGLAFAVRDALYKEQPEKEKGRLTGKTISVLVDSGVEDKRLFLSQPEFGAVLRIMARDGNSLSGVLREAWDGLTLAPMTKADRVRATDPHIGIVGHVTRDELLRNLSNTEASNGFGNRFVWLIVRRSKEIPFPSAPDESEREELASRIGKAVQVARNIGAVGMTDSFREAWEAVYHDLSASHLGLAGSLLGRSEAHVMRLSALYTVLEGQKDMGLVHLKAGLALWDYAEASTKLIFGDNTGDPEADTILRTIRERGELTDSEISDLFKRHISSSRLQQAKAHLESAELIQRESVTTGGRPRTIWRPTAKKAN